MNTHSRLFKTIAQILIGVMCGQPLLLVAADLRVDVTNGSSTQITQAGNGVPVVNIAKPNAKGLSHNQFTDYNVSKQGLILNNSTDKFTETQLGGIIIGNGHLQGKSAQLILNEVTGGQASQLKGYTEVAGKQAHVVVANPHGVTCDGCGFINTPHVTLTTGKPIIDQGRLSHYDVEGGQIEIAGAGLNATNISQFDLITRSAKINAELHANQLNIVTGRNTVDAQNLAATARADRPSDKPNLAIDSSALGGMYAGAIRLVGTEAGVGVKLAGDMAASAGDIQIDAKGKLTLARVSAKQQINANAQEVELTQQVYAGDRVKVQADKLTNTNKLLAANAMDITAKQLENQGLIEAGLRADNTLNSTADVRIKSTTVTNTGSVIASRNLQVDAKQKISNKAGQLVADADLTMTAKQLDNQQGLITTKGHVNVSAQQIDNRHQGEISSQTQLTVHTDTLDNRNSGRLISEADLLVTAQALDNRESGVIVADKVLTVRSDTIDNSAKGIIKGTQKLAITTDTLNNQGGGSVLSNADLRLETQQLNNTDGFLDTQGILSIVAQSINNIRGQIVGDSGVRISSETLDNRAGGLILSRNTLTATVNELNNQQGGVVADAGVALKGQSLSNDNGRIASQNNVEMDYADLNNTQGLIAAGNQLAVTAQTVENAKGELSAGQKLSLDTQLLQQKEGQILSSGEISLTAQTLDNSGKGLISAGTALTIQAEQFDNQQQGTVLSDGVLAIKANQLNNFDKGLLASKGLLQVQAKRLEQHNQGELISEKAIHLNLSDGDLDNSQGGLIYAPQLQLQGIALLNNSQGGEISTPNDLALKAALLNNAGGLVSSGKTLQVRVDGVINNTLKGLLSANQELYISAHSLDNSQKGTLIAKGDLSLLANQQLNNSVDGAILAGGKITLNSSTLNNTHSGLISSQQALAIQSSAIDNSQGGEISSLESIELNIGELNNQQGKLISEGSLELIQIAKKLDNRAGLIHAAGELLLNNLQDVDNSQSGEISSQKALQLTLDNLDNSYKGVIVSNEQLRIDAKHIDNQQEGLLSGLSGLQVSAYSVNNQNLGTLSSRAGKLTVQTAGQFNNSAQGALVSQQALNIQADNLDNQQGIISSEASVELQVASNIDNHSGQIAGRDITLSAESLFNTAGQISAEQTLAITLVKQLLNQQNASILSGQELLLTANTINNHDSAIASEGWLSVFAQHLRNEQQSTIAANDQLQLQAQKIDNQANIYSQNAGVVVQAERLNNTSGLIQARDDLALDITQQLSNQSGRIISEQGAVLVQAQAVDNREGVFASLLDRLTLDIRDLFNNQSGIAQGQGVAVQAHELTNQGGHIAATTTDLELSVASLNNQGGGLYAQQKLALIGHNLDNSAQGQIATKTIDFSLTGALNNQAGLIEAGRLHLLANTINNNQGRLRALAYADDSVIRASSSLDNRSGTVEVASTNFTLDTSNLLNKSGRIVHAGNGIFDLMSGHARNVGGTVISQGEVSVTSDSWENSTLFQAAALNFNVGHFKQTVSGQLIANRSLTATGNTWTNDGLIASDGSLALNLAGNYSGNGQVISLGDMQLTAKQFALGEQAVVYSLSAGRIDSQTLINQGYISAAAGLVIDAKQSLINYGTLGSEQQFSIYTPSLLNDNALIFSGADMRLGVDQLTNFYADVYSMGSIDLVGYKAGSQAQLVDNVSASMEAEGDFSLRSAVVENRRDILEIENKGKYYASIKELPCGAPYPTGDCKLGSNGKRNSVWQITEREKLEVINSSAASNFIAGGNLSFSGGELINSSSLISSGADLSLSLNQLNNLGVKPADIEVQSIHIAGRRPKYKYPVREAYAFNAKHNPAVQVNSVEADISRFIKKNIETRDWERKITETPLAGEEYSGIIQAGGKVSINAEQAMENGVIRSSYNYVSGGKRIDTPNPGSAYATEVSINAQLPPDLQQKQIDPTLLPGFNLPVGDKGLFRLSSQSVQNKQAQGADITNVTAGNGFARGDQLAQQDSQSSGQILLLSSQMGGVNPEQGSYGTSQAQLILANLQNLQGQNNGHRYLIETNPVLTQMRHFLSSDYLFGGLGLSSDQMQKRLGDGLFEQRLMREALVARTGQRFIAGLTSDEAVFRYLMDNAIASKDSLNLSVGVSLSAEQVAALTHDIVWMEEREVMGEKVITPVLYLAQTKGRLAPNGALIQGQDLTLVSGDLNNQGILRASNNLSAQAKNISNSGLIHAGERLSLLAEDSIYNRQGGILAGRDVDLTARTGDILNERTVTRHKSATGNSRWESSFADSAARIEATRDLTLTAGRDVHNLGSVLDSRGDLQISAGRDVTLASVEERHGNSRGSHYLNSQTTQLSSETLAGDNLNIQAGRDLTAIASRVESGKDMQLVAGNDLTLASAANENHSYSKSKKATSQRDQVRQEGTQVQSGGQFVAVAGQDLTLVSSAIAANDEAYLVAGGKVQLLAEQDYDYSFSEKKKKGSFGRKSLKSDEHTQITHIGSSVSSGGDLTLISGDEQRYQAANLNSGGDLTLDSGAGIVFEGVKDLEQKSRIRSKNSWVWQSSEGKGNTDETLIQSQLQAQGEIAIRAAEKIQIDIKEINQQSVSQTIDAMVQADPQLAWLKEMEQRGDVDWHQVKELHDSFKYSSSGLSGPAAMVIAIVVTYFTAGAGAGVALTGATSTAGIAASNTVVASMLSNAAISTINNKGNLGAALKDVTSSDSLKGYAVSGITAGLTAGVYDNWTSTQTGVSNTASVSNNTGVLANSGKVAVEGGLSTWGGVGQFAANQALQNVTSATLNKALGQDGDFGDALTSTLANTFAAAGFNWVGDVSKSNQIENGSLTKIGLHAIMGGLAAEAAGGDFKIGALAAGANEALIDTLANQYDNMSQDQRSSLLTMNSQVLGVLVASVAGGDEKDMQTGAWVAGNATQYNYLSHQELDAFEEQARNCKAQGNCDQVREEFRQLSVALDDELNQLCGVSPQDCFAIHGDFIEQRVSLQERMAQLSLDSSIPWRLRADLHVYQLQNTNAVGTLVQAANQQSFEDIGLSSEQAELAAMLAATMATGGVVGKASSSKGKVDGNTEEQAWVGGVKLDKTNQNPTSATTDAEAGGYSYYDKFKKQDGTWDWPENSGFAGPHVEATLPVGTRLDRYGKPKGSFLSPVGTPYEQRALAPGSRADGYHEYEVIKPLPVIQGKISPAFGESGGGTQILPNLPDKVDVQWLLRNGYLREIK